MDRRPSARRPTMSEVAAQAGYRGPPRHVTLPTRLVERGSGEIPPS
jgi:hypothetical protein